MLSAAQLQTLKACAFGATATFALFAGDGAFAQEPDPIEVKGELTIVTGLVDGELKSDANARLSATSSTVLQNGIELGGSATVRANGNEPAHRYAGGRYSSLLSGGTRGLGSDDGDVFLEGAYLFAKGGFGSVNIGHDAGVASRLAVTSPSIFRSIGVNDWQTDLTGLNDVHTVNDFSGQSAKISYMPPPGLLGGLIGQFQLGLSYAPEIGDCSADGCAPVSGFVVGPNGDLVSVEQSWQDVLETAVYYQNGIDIGKSPLTVGLSASYVHAEDGGDQTVDEALQPLFGDYRSYAVGMNVAYGNLTVGGSLKSSNAGLNQDRDEDYLAFDAGVTYETGEWNFMLGYGAAEAERDAALLVGPVLNGTLVPLGLDRQTQTAQAGISYVFDRGVTLGAAAQYVDSDKADALGGPEKAGAIVFESSIKF
ncbi:porin [Parvularcula sp. LCG005]|uniref:porin n=1 Tax=Parvularcula sp. LCG005 TaxID=3078805 RepID=UPI002941CC8A|nr:porin [Parvularcula sp. LCG005]WOI53222.1 porin [Parvularcula sp. LCG005]